MAVAGNVVITPQDAPAGKSVAHLHYERQAGRVPREVSERVKKSRGSGWSGGEGPHGVNLDVDVDVDVDVVVDVDPVACVGTL
jgi:hypothetical protein